jgi:hypothetical protein
VSFNGTANITLPTVNTSGNQTVGGTKTFSAAVVLSTAGTATTHAVRADRNIATGTGLTGGGNLTANRTFNIDIAAQAEAETGTNNTKVMTPLRVFQAIEASPLVGWQSPVEADVSGETEVTLTGIPDGVNEIAILFNEVGINTTSHILVQIGSGSGIQTAGYVSASEAQSGSGQVVRSSDEGFIVTRNNVARQFSGIMTLIRADSGNTWHQAHSGSLIQPGTALIATGGGLKTLTGSAPTILERLRVTIEGSGTFNNGSFTVRWRF